MALLPWKKVNYAVKMWKGDCDIPFWVYIETAFPVLLQMWFRYITFGQSDLLRMKTGRSQAKWTNKLFRGMTKYGPRVTMTNNKMLFKVDGILQRLFFAWLIMDILAEGFFRFTLLVHQSGNCNPTAGSGTLQRTQPFDDVFVVNTGWGAFFYPIVEQNSDNWLDSAAGVNLPPGEYQAVAGLNVVLDPSETKSVDMQIRLRVRDTLVDVKFPSGGSITPGPDCTGIVATATFRVPEGRIYLLNWEQHGTENALVRYCGGDLVVTRKGKIDVV